MGDLVKGEIKGGNPNAYSRYIQIPHLKVDP